MARDKEILQEVLDNYQNDTNEWADIYDEGTTDVRVLTGGAWQALDPIGARQRLDAKRPMLAPDELNQYINQGVNDWLANPRGILFSPAGDKATEAASRFYENKTREIQYRSRSDVAFGTAVENMFSRGFGYVRVSSKYVHSELFDANAPPDLTLFNQELWIEAVPNPNMILPDPYAQRPDLGDMKRCFVLQWRSVRDFKRDFPGAKVTNFTAAAVAGQAADWFSKDRKQVLVAEYWTKEVVKERTLLVLKPPAPSLKNPNPQPTGVWEDELDTKPRSDRILARRSVPIAQVKQRITNGIETLEEHEWKGQYIPITGCFGKVVYVDDGIKGAQKKILSMTRLARDPFMLHCYITTCQAEIVGGIPKFPYFYYEGQISKKNLQLLAKSVHEPVVAIPVKPFIPGTTIPGGGPLPFPIRNPYDGSSLQYLEILKESTRRAIQAAMGVTPLPAPVQAENQKSGKALKQIEASGQKGSFHFVDHANQMVQQTGEMIQDHMEHTYDNARDVVVMTPLGKTQTVRINDQNVEQPVSTEGTFQVTISAGPSDVSQRAAADEALDGLVGNLANVAPLLGPTPARKMLAQSIRNKVQGPAGDQLAEIIDPPQDAEMTPQTQAAMDQAQQLAAALDEAQRVIQSEQVKYQHLFEVEKMKITGEAALKIKLKEMDMAEAAAANAAKIEAARITAAKATMDQDLAAREELLALQLAHAHEASEADKDRAHELGTTALEQRHAMQQAVQENAQRAADAATTAPPTP